MTAETRRLLKQAIDAHVREQLTKPRVDFCPECSAAVDVPAGRRSALLCRECRGAGEESVNFSGLRREEESWSTKIASFVRSLRTPTPIVGTTQKAR